MPIPIVDRVPRFVQHALNADQARTRDSFGYEWTRLYPEHGHTTPEWQAERDIFLEYTRTVPSDFKGKLVLDGGCGNGRYAKLANDWGARVVAVDISSAVEIASRNVADRPRRRCRPGGSLQAAVPSGHVRHGVLGRRAAPHAGREGRVHRRFSRWSSRAACFRSSSTDRATGRSTRRIAGCARGPRRRPTTRPGGSARR